MDLIDVFGMQLHLLVLRFLELILLALVSVLGLA